MSDEWPDEWFRGRPGGGEAPGQPGASDRTVRLPGGTARAAGAGLPGGARAGADAPTDQGLRAGPRGGQGGPGGRGGPEVPAGSGGDWPRQPPVRTGGPGRGAAGRGAAGRGAAGAAGPGRRWLRPRRITAVVAVLLALVLIGVVAMYFFLDSKLDRKNILVSYAGQPAVTAGQNWLIAGSDSRQGLTRAQERKLATGVGIAGQRSDTIMLLHIPSGGGQPVLISLPRDSYLSIPGYGDNKLNAAYAFGGPALLARTVEKNTGLRIEHYMGIGFGGFVNVVNAVGGVDMCLKHKMRDRAAGLKLKKGCQTLNGGQALGFVRSRHLYAGQDLQRIQDQRLLLRALLSKLTSAGVLLNPLAAVPAATGAAATLTVDQGTRLYQLIEVAFALRHPLTTTIPIANANYVTANAGDAVLWDSAAAHRLFTALSNDQPVPKGLITGSHQG